MLKSLYIKNYALIDSLEVDFNPGFSVITGETGAGKSIILGALSLILGQRADTKAIKQGESKCVIEGIFDVKNYDLKAFCEEKGIEYDADSFILRREILSSGKSRGFINDSPVNLTDLKELGEQLIDIHSQHQNLLLGDNQFQLQVVDILSNAIDIQKEYKTTYNQYRHAEKELAILNTEISKAKEEEDYIRFQYETLQEASLVVGEQEELEAEQQMLNHAEEIKSSLYKTFQLLSDEQTGIVKQLKEGLKINESLSQFYAKAEDIAKRIDSSYLDMNDLSREVERLAGDIDFNAERLDRVASRLDLIYTLQTKYNANSITELIVLLNDFKQKLENIDFSDEQINKQKEKVLALKEKTTSLGEKLSKKRKTSSKNIEKNLINKISILGMPNVQFECSIKAKDEPDGTGMDDLNFLFSANKNIPLQPVYKIASGGEMSRLMLCLKSMIAGATSLPTLIFDEIDTGVSGEIADKMGSIMQEFGQNMQVLAITHLPQIAAKGNTHYKVYKKDDKKSTTTSLIQLSQEERLKEIAGMLSGSSLTDAALENAREMLNNM